MQQAAKNANISHVVELYKKVLTTACSAKATNIGFGVFNNTVMTYKQIRNGLSYFYCKRRVLPDGITTVPLDIVLKPYRK